MQCTEFLSCCKLYLGLPQYQCCRECVAAASTTVIMSAVHALMVVFLCHLEWCCRDRTRF